VNSNSNQAKPGLGSASSLGALLRLSDLDIDLDLDLDIDLDLDLDLDLDISLGYEAFLSSYEACWRLTVNGWRDLGNTGDYAVGFLQYGSADSDSISPPQDHDQDQDQYVSSSDAATWLRLAQTKGLPSSRGLDTTFMVTTMDLPTNGHRQENRHPIRVRVRVRIRVIGSGPINDWI